MVTKENIHAGHRIRMREHAENIGIDKMNEHQILEMLLSFIIPYKDTNPTAHALIKEFGSLANVLDSEPSALIKVKGVGEKSASFLSSIPNIFIAYKKSRTETGEPLNNARKIVEFFCKNIEMGKIESFYYLCLDASGCVVKFDCMGDSGVDNIILNIKDFAFNILKHKASGVAICHTHPRGLPIPSMADNDFTERLSTAIKALGIQFIDHIIIGQNGYYSYYNHSDSSSNTTVLNSFKNIRLSQPKIKYEKCDENEGFLKDDR